MQIGIAELLIVFIVALFAVGPDRLPGYARKLGEAVAQFKKYSQEATREIKESVVEPLEEVQAPLREAVKPLEDLDKTVRGSAKDLKDSFAGIGKQKRTGPPPEAAAPTEAEAAERGNSEGPAAAETVAFEEKTSI